MKANIVTKTGLLVCECSDHHEAMKCISGLIKIDKADATYEQGYYKIIPVDKK